MLHNDDWTKDVNFVRVKRLLDPEKDLDGDGQSDDEQNEEGGVRANKGVAGQFIGGVFFSKSQIELKIKEREVQYFDLLDLAKRVNNGLNGDLTKHSRPEKISKIMSVDINAYQHGLADYHEETMKMERDHREKRIK